MYRQWSQVEYYIIIWTGFRFSNTDVTFFCATIHKTREDNSTTTTVRLCTCTLDNNNSSQYTLIIGTRPSPSFIHSLESVSHRISSHSRWWTYTTQHNTWPRRYELEGTPFTFHSLHQLMLRWYRVFERNSLNHSFTLALWIHRSDINHTMTVTFIIYYLSV